MDSDGSGGRGRRQVESTPRAGRIRRKACATATVTGLWHRGPKPKTDGVDTPMRTRLALPLVLLAAVGLNACSDEPEGSPQEVADQVAAALETGDFSRAPLVPQDGAPAEGEGGGSDPTEGAPAGVDAAVTSAVPDGVAGEAAQARDVAYAGMGEVPLTVEAGDVSVTEESAEATLTLTWDLEGDEEFQLTAPLTMNVVDGAWAATWQPDVLGIRPGNHLSLRTVAAERADLVDRDGEPLLTERPVRRFGIDKTLVEADEAAESAQALAEAAGITPGDFVAAVEAAGPEAFVDLITYRESDGDGDALAAAADDIPGARALEEEQVLGPTRTFAQPLLGRVGPVTQEIMEADPGQYQVGDVVGLSGLAAALEDDLAGSPGLLVVEESADGEVVDTLLERAAEDAEPVRLTLDSGLQELAEETLADVGPSSAIVALDSASGDLLAVANGPGSEGVDTALAGQYAPGSTFKLVTALALLRSGMTPESTVECTDSLDVDGYRVTNVEEYPASQLGEIPLSSALAHSCNTAFVAQRDAVSMGDLASAAADLGLGGTWGMPVTAFSGSVPEDAETETEHAVSMIGQGRVLVSPAAMAGVVASIHQGSTVVPRVLAHDGGADDATATTAAPGGELSPEETAALEEMMRGVVTQGGASMLEDVPGDPVLAKTGTAEFGEEDPPLTHVWMVATQGDLAVAVFVEEGFRGSATAGPLMDAFLTGAAED